MFSQHSCIWIACLFGTLPDQLQRNELTRGCVLSWGSWDLNLGPLKEQKLLWTLTDLSNPISIFKGLFVFIWCIGMLAYMSMHKGSAMPMQSQRGCWIPCSWVIVYCAPSYKCAKKGTYFRWRVMDTLNH